MVSELTYETKIIDPNTEFVLVVGIYTMSQETLDVFAMNGAVAKGDVRRSGGLKYASKGIGVKYKDPEFAVASKKDLALAGGQPVTKSYTLARQSMQAQVADSVDNWQIVSLEEALIP